MKETIKQEIKRLEAGLRDEGLSDSNLERLKSLKRGQRRDRQREKRKIVLKNALAAAHADIDFLNDANTRVLLGRLLRVLDLLVGGEEE